jgi:hypothetical protein
LRESGHRCGAGEHHQTESGGFHVVSLKVVPISKWRAGVKRRSFCAERVA